MTTLSGGERHDPERRRDRNLRERLAGRASRRTGTTISTGLAITAPGASRTACRRARAERDPLRGICFDSRGTKVRKSGSIERPSRAGGNGRGFDRHGATPSKLKPRRSTRRSRRSAADACERRAGDSGGMLNARRRTNSTEGSGSKTIFVSVSGSQANLSGSVSLSTTSGDGAIGLYAVNGGVISRSGDDRHDLDLRNQLEIDGLSAFGAFADGAGSQINLAGATIMTTGQGAVGLYASSTGRRRKAAAGPSLFRARFRSPPERRRMPTAPGRRAPARRLRSTAQARSRSTAAHTRSMPRTAA